MLGRFLLFLLCAMASPAAVTAIRDVTVIDPGRGIPHPHSTVVIRDDRIAASGPLRSTRIPAGARVLDGRGKFLIPGLWDMHVHLWYQQNQLPTYVANGITGVRDMGSDFRRVVEWRREILEGRAVGPHVLSCGPPVVSKQPDDAKLPGLVARNPEEARRAVDELESLGVDFVKVLSDLPRDSYIALAERARQLQMDFAGHVPTSVAAWDVVDARQNSIEHLFGLFRALATDPEKPLETFSDEKAHEFFERCAMFASAQVPTLTLWQRMAFVNAAARMKDPRLKQVPAAIRASWPKPEEEMKNAAARDAAEARAQLALADRMVRLMRDCGVEILAGTDTGDPYTIPGVTLHEELALLVKAGLTPVEALRTATTAPAHFLGWDESTGRIEPGYVADLVLLTADPLGDIRNVSKIAAVFTRGRLLGPVQIRRILAPR